MRRRYDEAFRREAARERSVRQVIPHELGISALSRYNWGRVDATPRAAGPLRSLESREEPQVENERLKRELARLTEQRDILKKASGILAEPSPSGMPRAKR